MEDGVGFEPTQTFVPTEVAAPPLKPLEYPPYVYGAPSRTRTGTGLSPREFKSLVSTYFTTRAFGLPGRIWTSDLTIISRAIYHWYTGKYMALTEGFEPSGVVSSHKFSRLGCCDRFSMSAGIKFILVRITGFEPVTSWSQITRSSQAELNPDI